MIGRKKKIVKNNYENMEQIIRAFEEHFLKNGVKNYNELYVGIAKNPADRLQNGHNIKSEDLYTYWNVPLHTEIVRNLEKYFLNKGCKGGPGGGDNNTCYLYMYKITPHTRE